VPLTYNIHQAKTQFSRIIARVVAGEEVLIAKAGEPIAKIVPVRGTGARVPNSQTEVYVAEDFDDDLPPDLLDAFDGRS
jgi:prevent-host-death family protein